MWRADGLVTFSEMQNVRPGPTESDRTLQFNRSPGSSVGTEGRGTLMKRHVLQQVFLKNLEDAGMALLWLSRR